MNKTTPKVSFLFADWQTGNKTQPSSGLFDHPVTVTQRGLPVCAQLVAEIEQLNTTDAPQQMAQIVEERYSWFSNRNRAEADQHVAALRLAWRYALPHQINGYKAQLIELYTRDMAERTTWLVQYQLGYPEFRYTQPTRLLDMPYSFTVPIKTWGWTEQQWVYSPLVAFPQLIPDHALRAMAALDQAQILPDGMWVADKVEMVRPQVSLDPVLCCNFGRYFVGIAQWE